MERNHGEGNRMRGSRNAVDVKRGRRTFGGGEELLIVQKNITHSDMLAFISIEDGSR